MSNQEKRPQRTVPAERRLVTVVFCDLVGSTRMGETMDPDDLGWLAIKYEALCTASTAAFGGYVERFEGDGMVACFGYPYALENGAQRAVSAALDLVEAIRLADWSALTSEPVRVRVGIDTGVVLSGDVVREDGLSQLSVLAGLTLNIASRMQELASPDSVLISGVTHELVVDQFETECLGERELKGLSKPVVVHRVLKPAPLVQQVNRVRRGKLVPLAGRQRELQMLLEGWAKAQVGEGSVRGIAGEPGIGKSRLVADLRGVVELGKRATVIEMQCSPYHSSTSFFPILESLKKEVAGSDQRSEQAWSNLRQLLERCGLDANEGSRLLAPLLSIEAQPDGDATPLSPEARKSRTTTLLADWVLSHAGENALLLVVEDVQWMDPSSLEVIQAILARIARGDYRVFVLLSFRSDFDPIVCGIQGPEQTVTLTRLSDSEVERLVFNVGGGRIFPKEVLRQIVDNAEGVPLFAEELTKSIVRSGALADRGSHYEPVSWRPVLAVPSTLHDLLRRRLDEVGESRVVAQAAAVLGRTVAKSTLMKLVDVEAEGLERDLDRLVQDGIMEVSDDRTMFSFRHALIQRAAYESLPKRSLHEYHVRAARLLAAQDDAVSSTQPELVAQHFSLGDMAEQAVPLWLGAAARSIRRSANMEAIAQADQGIDAIRAAKRPVIFRQAELFLHMTKGMALTATRGWSVPAAGEIFARAAELSEGLPGTDHTPAVWGLWAYNLMRADLPRAEAYAEQLLRIGEASGDARILIEGHWTLGNTRFWQQRIEEAQRHLEEAVRLYDRDVHRQNAYIYGQDPGVGALVFLIFVHSYRGEVVKAIERGEQALALASQVGHPFSTAWARGANAMLRIELNDVPGTIAFGEEALRYAMEQEQAFWIAAMQMAVGWARTRSGDTANGIQMAEQGIQLYQSMGAGIALGFFYTLLADCYLTAGDAKTAAAWVDEGFKNAASDQMYRPGLLLVRGILSLGRGMFQEAESDLREGLEMCVAKGARMRQLHAGMALAQLLAARGDVAAAADTLNHVLAWFREQKDASITQHAEQLLRSLTAPA